MKFAKSPILALALLALAIPVISTQAAAPDPVNGWAVTTTNGGTTLSYAIVSPRGTQSGAAVRVQYLNATSDKSTSKVQFYKVDAQSAITYTNSTTTLFVNTTNNGVNWQSGTVIIRHNIDDSYEKRTLGANTGSTNIAVTVAPMGTVLPGDIVYHVTTTGAGSIPVGSATLTLGPTSGAIYIGQKDKPLLLEIDATTSGTLNVASGDYVR